MSTIDSATVYCIAEESKVSQDSFTNRNTNNWWCYKQPSAVIVILKVHSVSVCLSRGRQQTSRENLGYYNSLVCYLSSYRGPPTASVKYYKYKDDLTLM